MMQKFFWIAKIFYIPIILYGTFFFLKILGKEPSVDLNGMHSMMGAIFLSFGTGVAYFMSILPLWIPFDPAKRIRGAFWFLSALFLLLLLSDAAFRIHENLYGYFGIPESITFMFYGGLLVSLVFCYRNTLHKPFFLFFVSFVLISGIAVAGDATIAHEGVIVVGGRSYSYEQFCETLSTLVLGSAFFSEAVWDLKNLAQNSNSFELSGQHIESSNLTRLD